MNGRFHGAVALVVGIARPPGIGAAVARRLAAEGALVVGADQVGPARPDPSDTTRVDEHTFQRTIAEVGAAGAVTVELSDPGSVDAMVAAAVAAHGHIALCAMMAGGTGPEFGNGALVDLDDGSFVRCMNVNLAGAFRVNRAVARRMRDAGAGGAIVNLSTHATRAATPGFGAFAAARAGVEMLTRVLAQELGPHGIRVNAVAPLGIGAAGGPGAPPPHNPGLAAVSMHGGGPFGTLGPLGRLQSADETAAVVAHLMSQDASYVTGETVYVSGGR